MDIYLDKIKSEDMKEIYKNFYNSLEFKFAYKKNISILKFFITDGILSFDNLLMSYTVE